MRASVPGTVEAEDAVLLASVPQSAVVNRKAAAAQAGVKYVGEPEFKPIPTTTLEYANEHTGRCHKVAGQVLSPSGRSLVCVGVGDRALGSCGHDTAGDL